MLQLILHLFDSEFLCDGLKSEYNIFLQQTLNCAMHALEGGLTVAC